MNKSFKVFSLSILMLVILVSAVSALTITSSTNTLSQDGGSLTLTISEATADEDVEFTASTTITDSDGDTIEFSPTFPSTITVNSSGDGSLDMDYTTTDFDFEFDETYSVIITATEDANPENNDTVTLTFEQTPFYDGENEGKLKISNIEFNTLEGFGDDEDYWYPLDEVEIQFDVDNDGDWDIEDIEIKACLWDEDAEECIFDEDDMEIDDDKFDLDSDDDKTVTITLNVDPDELTGGSTDYTFYVKAVGNIDDNDAGEYDGDETGDSDSQGIEIRTNEDFVVLDNIELSETASCGSELQITADVWNVGDEDQDDVYVIIYNKELGIDKKVEIGDINDFEDEKLDVTITLPEDVEEKEYDLIFTVFDEDDDVYENDEDDLAEFSVPLTIEGSCSTVPTATISASLQSDAKSGEALIVKAVIINTGSETKTFSVSASNYANWASLGSIDKTSVTIEAGKSQDVLIALNVNGDVSGEEKFNIELIEGDKFMSQPVSVTIEQSSNIPSLTGLFSGMGGDNWYLWGIGALNVILVLVIVIVAIKVARKKE